MVLVQPEPLQPFERGPLEPSVLGFGLFEPYVPLRATTERKRPKRESCRGKRRPLPTMIQTLNTRRARENPVPCNIAMVNNDNALFLAGILCFGFFRSFRNACHIVLIGIFFVHGFFQRGIQLNITISLHTGSGRNQLTDDNVLLKAD